MASVTGMTAAAIDALMGDMLVSADIDETGQMIFTKRNGGTVNAGAVVPPQIATDKAWPINSIFVSTVPTSPADLLGIGVWTRFGKGRTLVSLDEDQVEFDTAAEVGGAKTVTLDTTQIPSHTHTMAHTHDVSLSFDVDPAQSGAGVNKVSNIQLNGTLGIDRSAATSGVSTPNTGATGGAGPHNNLPPYIVVYMWKRTA